MKILLTNRALLSLGGSELVTVELAEHFTAQGHDVTVYSPFVGGTKLSTTHLNVVTERPYTAPFDLLWIHHNMLIHELGFRKHAHQIMIFNHMSSYVGCEWPKIPGYEMALADRILANSAETRAVLEDKGLRGVELFQNPAPATFTTGRPLWEVGVVVSNHPPAEVDALGLSVIGRDAGRRVTSQMLSEYRFVICNGKTTQMALRSGVPVYLYDHFSGPGWLTEENFERAEYYNFSGRGFAKKTADEIRKELAVIPKPLACPDRFKLERRLGELGL